MMSIGRVVRVGLALLVLGLPASAQTGRRSFDLLTATVPEIQDAVAAGALTYEKLVRLYLNRIEAYNANGPKLNAVLQIHPRALDMARALDAERTRTGLRSPLHGIPIAVKDNLDVSDMPSAGGTPVLGGTFPPRDATVIGRLREAGAIIFLKTNMDELALGSQGLSALGGQILNPYDLARNPGGSSGGTGVAVTTGFATLGIATETGVSIRSPATNNSIVGIAPTRGLVSRAGVIPVSFTQDRVGPHAKTVADAALLLSYMRGLDADDLLTSRSAGRVLGSSYIEDTRHATLAGVRIGVLKDLFREGLVFQAVNQVVLEQVALMRQRGAIVTDGLTTGADLIALVPSLRVNRYELKLALDGYFARRGPASPVKSLEDLIAAGRHMESLDNQLREAVKVERLDSNREYLSRLDLQRHVRRQLVDLMERHGVEVLVYPFKSLGAPPIGTSDGGIRDNPVSSTTGLPAVVVPAGVDAQGLPISIEFLGRPFSERALIRIAHAYEAASRKRLQPPTTPHLAGEVFTY